MTRTIALILLLLVVASCTAIRRDEAESTGDVLAAAGFTPKFADDESEQAKLTQMKPLTLVRRVRHGETVYTWADPYFCKCVYVGTQPQYAEYQRLSLEKQIAEERVMVADEEEDAMMGPWFWW